MWTAPRSRPNLATALKVTLDELEELLSLGDLGDPRPEDHDHLGYALPATASQQIANPGLDVLIRGAGYCSLEHFAQAVNGRAHQMYGLHTKYDRITVKRWLSGSASPTPDAVAAVLSDAWGIPVPAEVIWPQLSNGQPSTPAHLQPWAASRTLEALGILVRCDMLTRRETLTEAVKAVTGPALLTPIARWLDALPGRIEPRDQGTQRIGADDVEAIERSTRHFAATDAQIGGTFSREAAAGLLKYAIDLAQNASYKQSIGNRLLAAIAELSGLLGWLSHDAGMAGPAQRYLTYGLQAARESADPRAKHLVVSILDDMAEHVRWLGRPQVAIHLYYLAFNQLSADRRLNALRGLLTVRRAANGLCHLGPSRIPEVREALTLSFDLYGQADEDDRTTIGSTWHRVTDAHVSELSAPAAVACLTLAKHDARLAA